jgi:hypothetical protein
MIKFKDLSIPLRIGMIVSWIVASYWVSLFTIGFFIGLLGI